MFVWVIQDSKGKHYNWTELSMAIKKAKSRYIFCEKAKIKEIKLEVNEFPIIIGGDDFLEEAEKNRELKKGIFKNESFFNVSSYKKIWKEAYLNNENYLISAEELKEKLEEKSLFVRPLMDSKCFDGQIITKLEIEKILNKCNSCSNNRKKCISVSRVKSIYKEWRAVIINNKCVTICRYLKNGKREVSKSDISEKLISFCRKASTSCKSAPIIWVMDIAEVENKFYVLECNIFNASNFYDCDRFQIVIELERALSAIYM